MTKVMFTNQTSTQTKKYLKTSRKDLVSFYNHYGISMPVPPSHKTQIFHSKRKSPSSKTYPKRHYKKYKNYNNYKPYHHKNPTKKVIKCFKCGKEGHIASNCKNQKINAFSDKDYYLEISEDDSSSSDNSKNNKSASKKYLTSNDKIENCLCQINMLTAY